MNKGGEEGGAHLELAGEQQRVLVHDRLVLLLEAALLHPVRQQAVGALLPVDAEGAWHLLLEMDVQNAAGVDVNICDLALCGV